MEPPMVIVVHEFESDELGVEVAMLTEGLVAHHLDEARTHEVDEFALRAGDRLAVGDGGGGAGHRDLGAL